MTVELRTYPAYRETGLQWLDRVPAHWDVRRNGRLFAQRNETGHSSLPILEVSLKTGVRVRDMENLKRKQVMSDREKYKRAAKNDIAYNMMRMWQGAVGVAPEDGLVSPAYVVARPYAEAEPRYFSHLFRTDVYKNEVDGYSRGIVKDRNRLYWEDFKRMQSCTPPREEQEAIADYLDAYTIKVRRFVRNRRRLIEVLNEQKQAIVNRAVTRGLDPNVRLKSSGVHWFGDIPGHWQLRRIRTLVSRIDQGVSPQAENLLAENGAWGVLKAGCVNHGVFRPGQHKRLPDGFEFDSALQVSPGDVLVSRACGSSDLVGSVGRVTSSPYKLILSDKTFRLVFRSPAHVEFYVDSMNSTMYRRQVRLAISGAEGLANNLPLSSLRDFVLPFPPGEEAAQIAELIHAECQCLGRAVSVAEHEIELIREHRTRLIADVVTGKLDVRGLASAPGSEIAEDLDEGIDDEDVLGDDEPQLVEEVASDEN